ncbi:MAG: tetratricopeptide repeat protein [Candidatus Ratteibacteria bacterium]
MDKRRIKIYLTIFLFGILSIKFYESRIINVLWLKADKAFHLGNYDLAEKCLWRIIKQKPEEVNAYVLKAWLEWSQAITKNDDKKLNSAIKTLRLGQWYNPFNFQLYLEEGIMWNAFGNDQEALNAFKKVYITGTIPYVRIYPHKLRQMGRIYEAYKVMEKIYEKYKDEVTSECLERLKKQIST